MRASKGLFGSEHTSQQRLRSIAIRVFTLAVIIVVWEFGVQFGQISPRTLASPSSIVRSMTRTWPSLLASAYVTTYEVLWGFVFAIVSGVLVGIMLYRWDLFKQAAFPLLVAAQTLPLITIAPLFMLWFGYHPLGKIVLVAIFGMFSIAVQTLRGLQSVPHYYSDVALTCGATTTWTLWHVQLRVASHQIFSGIRISAAYVFGTAVTAEYLGSKGGFGIWIQSAFNSFQTAPIFSATIMIIAETGLLMAVVSLVEYLMIGNDDMAELSGN